MSPHLSLRKLHRPVGRFPPPGPFRAGSPTSQVLSADSDFSPPLAHRFVSFARHYHRLRPPSLPRGGTRSPWTRTISHRGARAASARWRRRDLPGSWTTLAYMPRSSTPTERRPPGPFGTGDGVFPPCKRRRLREDDSFGAQSRGLHAPCVRFAAGVTPGLRNTRFRLGASLGRSGLSPAGSHRRFPPCLSLYMPSPFTKLRLAQLHPISSATHSRFPSANAPLVEMTPHLQAT